MCSLAYILAIGSTLGDSQILGNDCNSYGKRGKNKIKAAHHTSYLSEAQTKYPLSWEWTLYFSTPLGTHECHNYSGSANKYFSRLQIPLKHVELMVLIGV